MKILYVEDEFAHVMLAERTLAESIQQEFLLIHAETMKEALQILRDQPDIDLVLSDLRLPDGSGLELLQKIRASKSAPAVVLVTGQGDQEVAVAALKAGAADYLVKQSDYLHRLPVVLSNAIAQNRLVREQEALRQAEVKYQSLVEQLPAVVFLDRVDEQETPLYISPRIKELTGYSPEEWYVNPEIWAQRLHPEDKERILAQNKYSRQAGTRFLEEYRIIRRDGSIVWVKEDTNLICDSRGTALYWQGILLDITKEKESLETIRKSEERFRRIFHASPIATCVTRMQDGKFIDANQSYLNLIGKTFETLRAAGSFEMDLWTDEEERQNRILQLQKEGMLRGLEHQFVNVPDGPRDSIAYYELIELGGQICVLAMFYDVTEEKKAQKDLQNERDFALLVLNNMGQGLTVTDKDGQFAYVNPAFARMLGYKSEEMLEKRPSDFTAEASKSRLGEEKALRRKGLTTSYESTFLHRDSHEVPTLITGVPRWDHGNVTGTIAVITDLTDRKNTEEALARQVKELTVLHSVAIAAAESEREDEIIERVTHIIGQLYPEVCGVLLLDESGNSLTPHPSNVGAQLPTWRDSYPVSTGITGRAVIFDKIICVSDVSQDAEYIQIASGICSELAVPIRVNGRVIGVLNVESQKRAAFNENDERFLSTVASSMGTALERLRFLKEEQRHHREAELLREWTAILAASLEFNRLFESILTAISDLIPNDSASIFIANPLGEMTIVATRGIPEPQNFIGRTLSKGQKWHSSDDAREATIIGDVSNNPLFEKWEGTEYIRSWMGIPLTSQDKIIGYISLDSRKLNAFTRRDATTGQTFANSAAIALGNARLYQDALRAAERRAVLHRISQDIVRFGQDFEQIYAAIHEAAMKLMSCDVFLISLKDESANQNVGVYSVEAGVRYPRESTPFDEGLTGAVISSGKSIILQNEIEIEQGKFIRFGSPRHVRSVVAVPMRISDKTIGMIAAQSYEQSAYGAEEQSLLEMLATHAATAIENGRLFESEQKRRQEAENLRQAAAAISSTLDPDHVMTDILSALKKVIHYDNASVFLLEGERLRLAICQGFLDSQNLVGLKFPARDELFQEIKRSKRPVIIEDAQLNPRFRNWGDAELVHSWMSIPLISMGSVIGYITLDNYQTGAYSEGISATAMAFANQAAAALGNARLFQEQIRRSKIIEALADIANEIATTRDVLPALGQITQRALDMLDAHHVAIYLLQDDLHTLKVVAAHGTYKKELLGHTIKVGDGMTGNIFLKARAEIINDTHQDPRRVTVPGTPEKEEKLESLMSAPLILRGRTIGVINAWRLKENGLFNESELNFLVGIAHQVSICIESGRLFQETSRQAQEAAAIAEVGRDISATLDLDVVLERIASYAMDLLNAETSAVYLAEGHYLHATAALGFDAEAIKNDSLKIGNGILGNIALQNMGEIVNDTENDPRTVIVKGTEKNPLEHIMGVPILMKDKHTGLLAVWRSGIGTEFMPKELDFLTSLARQAAVAIENARLYDETQRRVQELEIINRVSTSMRTAQSIAEMLSILLNEGMGLLKTPHGSIWTYNHATNRLVQKLAAGDQSNLMYRSLSPVDGIVGKTFTTGSRHVSPELKSDPLLFEPNRQSMTPGLAGICIPIQSTAGPVGVLVIAVEPERLTDEATNLLVILAEITGNSIHRVQLYEQSQKQVRRLTTLRDIDSAIASSFDLRLTLSILMDQTITHLNVDAVDIGLYQPDIQGLTYIASAGFQIASPTRPQIRFGEGLAGRVIARQATLHVTDLQNAPEAKNEMIVRREGFVTYIGIPLIVKGQIKGVFEVFHRAPLSPTPDWMDFLHTLAGQAAIAIDSSQLFESMQRSNQELMQAYDTTLEGWARALEIRDRETEGHTRRVTEMTLRLARYMGLSDNALVNIHRGVLLHDIGKMGVPDHILKKTGKLDAEEWVEMRKHPVYAYNLLSPIAYLRGALDIPYCHHEHWDGSGYPRGLQGEQIPLSARIFSVIDIWDALLSDRPYRKAWGREKVVDYLHEVAGTLLDPSIVKVFFQMMEDESKEMG